MTELGHEQTAKRLRTKLRKFGLTSASIDAAWPEWWSADADASPSAQTELRFSLARKLGLDPRSLLDDAEGPRFIWRDEARFKHLTRVTDLDKGAITSFAKAIGAILAGAVPDSFSAPLDAETLRSAILRNAPYVRLLDLLSTSWALGIPVAHLRLFPRKQKRMAAVTVSVGGRFVILLAKDSSFPPWTAFHLAHELGHIAHGHLRPDEVIVDFESDIPAVNDAEEVEADQYSLTLLTGSPTPRVMPGTDRYTARGLAAAALAASQEVGIEPGVLALCFGYATSNWRTANAAVKHIYSGPKAVWQEINRIAWRQIQVDRLPQDQLHFLRAVLGIPEEV
jgi:hypothetical protein